MITEGYVGFFDSGIGGLTLLAECVSRLPEEKFLYLGDNGNAPYGGRTEEEIRALAAENFALLAGYPLKAAVIACNTVTAHAASALRASFPFPIVGVEPALRPAAASGAEHILVLATQATLSSGSYARLLESAGDARIVCFAPEKLAAAVEENIFSPEKIDLRDHLPPVKCDAVVLGCTHYIFLKKRIEKFYGCRAFDGNAGAAEKLCSILQNAERGGFPENSGMADHLNRKTNICSKKVKKTAENSIIFLGKAKNKNKSVFFSRF